VSQKDIGTTRDCLSRTASTGRRGAIDSESGRDPGCQRVEIEEQSHPRILGQMERFTGGGCHVGDRASTAGFQTEIA